MSEANWTEDTDGIEGAFELLADDGTMIAWVRPELEGIAWDAWAGNERSSHGSVRANFAIPAHVSAARRAATEQAERWLREQGLL